MRLGILAFIVPFAFCYDSGMILHGTIVQNLAAIAGGVAAALALGFSVEGFMAGPLKPLQRSIFIALGCLSLTPVLVTKIPALVSVILYMFVLSKKPGISPVGE